MLAPGLPEAQNGVGVGGGVGVAGGVGVGGRVGTNGVAVGVPKGVGVAAGGDVATAVGLPGVGEIVGGTEVSPIPGVDVVDSVPVSVGVIPGTADPSGGGVTKVPLAAAVGVGLARPLFGSEGDSELHAPSRAAKKSAAARNGLRKRIWHPGAAKSPRQVR